MAPHLLGSHLSACTQSDCHPFLPCLPGTGLTLLFPQLTHLNPASVSVPVAIRWWSHTSQSRPGSRHCPIQCWKQLTRVSLWLPDFSLLTSDKTQRHVRYRHTVTIVYVFRQNCLARPILRGIAQRPFLARSSARPTAPLGF